MGSSPLEAVDELTPRLARTEPRVKALRILVDRGGRVRGGVTATEFARAMWPDAEGWQRVYRCGPKGSHRGTGMVLAGAGFLGKLVAAGLVRRRISDTGQSFFAASRIGARNLAAWESSP